MNTLLGCIADDVAGATELASVLARSGMWVRLHLGVPEQVESPVAQDGADDDHSAPFEIIALNPRSACTSVVVKEAVQAWQWLSRQGVRRVYWKYQLTSDGQACEHIGPVADALLDAIAEVRGLDTNLMSVHCTTATQSGDPLSSSQSLTDRQCKDHQYKHHQCRDDQREHVSKLISVLSAQTRRRVDNMPCSILACEQEQIRDRLGELAAGGVSHIVGNAVSSADLVSLVRATERFPLICGSSAQALHLPALFRIRGFLSSADEQAPRPSPKGAVLALIDDSSEVARRQVQAWPAHLPSMRLDPAQLTTHDERTAAVAAFVVVLAEAQAKNCALLVHADRRNAEPPRADQADARIESVLADCALEAFGHDVRRFIAAGEQTVAAVSGALGIHCLEVGHEIAHGAPWCRAQVSVPNASGTAEIAIALKLDSSGEEHFFSEALERIEPPVRD